MTHARMKGSSVGGGHGGQLGTEDQGAAKSAGPGLRVESQGSDV